MDIEYESIGNNSNRPSIKKHIKTMAIMNMASYRDEASNNQNSFVACEN